MPESVSCWSPCSTHNKIVHNKEQATEMGIFNGDGIQLEVGTEFYRK